MNGSDPLAPRDGLIGHTGFVGSALLRQARFAACFNSANIATIAGQAFGTLVCAAAPGSMLEASRAPERDAAQIDALIARLATVRAERFVLISSIAVLADFAGGDDEATQAFQQELAYGRHRRALEAFVEENFPGSLIIRLPALFGAGLRKNFLFDLMNPVPSLLTEAKRDALIGALEAVGAGTDNLGVAVEDRVAFGLQGEAIATLRLPQIVTSWDRIHRLLRHTKAGARRRFVGFMLGWVIVWDDAVRHIGQDS